MQPPHAFGNAFGRLFARLKKKNKRMATTKERTNGKIKQIKANRFEFKMRTAVLRTSYCTAAPSAASSPASSSSSGVVFSVGNGCSGWNADPKDGFSWNAVVHGLKQAVFVLVSASVSFKLTFEE